MLIYQRIQDIWPHTFLSITDKNALLKLCSLWLYLFAFGKMTKKKVNRHVEPTTRLKLKAKRIEDIFACIGEPALSLSRSRELLMFALIECSFWVNVHRAYTKHRVLNSGEPNWFSVSPQKPTSTHAFRSATEATRFSRASR